MNYFFSKIEFLKTEKNSSKTWIFFSKFKKKSNQKKAKRYELERNTFKSP